MSKHKIQLFVNDNTINILNKLSRNDKARFIDCAIDMAFKSEKINKYFNWVDDSVAEKKTTQPEKKPPVDVKIKIDSKW